jgi:hypothetical protein
MNSKQVHLLTGKSAVYEKEVMLGSVGGNVYVMSIVVNKTMTGKKEKELAFYVTNEKLVEIADKILEFAKEHRNE